MSVENMGNGYVKVGVKAGRFRGKYSGIKAVKTDFAGASHTRKRKQYAAGSYRQSRDRKTF